MLTTDIRQHHALVALNSDRYRSTLSTIVLSLSAFSRTVVGVGTRAASAPVSVVQIAASKMWSQLRCPICRLHVTTVRKSKSNEFVQLREAALWCEQLCNAARHSAAMLCILQPEAAQHRCWGVVEEWRMGVRGVD